MKRMPICNKKEPEGSLFYFPSNEMASQATM